jgi:rare lipoprotein A
MPAPAPATDSADLSPMRAGDTSAVRFADASARGFWVQLGAFREASGAEGFQSRVAADVDWLTPYLATFGEAALFRVQAGPYASREEAQAAAARIREALGLVPLVVQRR